MDDAFYCSPDELRDWLEAHGDTEDELWVGFHRQRTGRARLTWAQAVDEALCRGWIDGIRKGVDEERYRIRFTPRRKGSTWSVVEDSRSGRRLQHLTRPSPR